MIKYIIYFLSSASVLASSVISPAMGEITAYFHDVNPTLVKMIMTMPALFMIISAYLANPISRKIGKKYTLLLALTIYLFSGVGCAFATEIYTILVCRAVLGVGLGIMVPITQSLPIDLFTDTYERNEVMARQGASINAGNMVLTLIAGALASISWRYTFTIYSVALPLMLLIIFYLPNIQNKKKEKIDEDIDNHQHTHDKLPKAVYVIAFTLFCLFTAIVSFYVNIAILIHERAIGDSKLASYILSTGAFASFCLAMNLQKILTIVKDRLLIIVLFLTGAGFMVLNYTYTPPALFIVTMLTSAGAGCIIPSSIMKVGSLVEKHQSVRALAILNSCMYIGQFVSPILFDILPILPLAKDFTGGKFLTMGMIMLLCSIALLIKKIIEDKKI